MRPVTFHSDLDRAWYEINALAGWHHPNDRFATGYSEAIGHALAVIERLGGRDPLSRKAPAGLGLSASDVLPAPGRTYQDTMRRARLDALQGKPDGEAA